MVLISQDGVQLPPLSFSTGNSLLSFLTCLEQGLGPGGRLDPPLVHQKNNSVISWPKLKKNIKSMYAGKDAVTNDDSQDFVFRLVFSSVSNIGELLFCFTFYKNCPVKNLKTLESELSIIY